ncbi:hypothetical protein AB0G35_02595 [Streptomyces sp. NPDC021749]|uniref:hypothetical protein n=1 Tax=Streptomyces sp. NPDC021749 TaxID=3154905 RepID=UPI0033C645C3
MAHRPRRGAVALLGGRVPALAAAAAPFQAIAAKPSTAAPAAAGSGMVMVLDSSGSMSGSDGSGGTLPQALSFVRAGGPPPPQYVRPWAPSRTPCPAALGMGTVPVAWTNRYETHPDVIPVHEIGDFCIAVTLGARAAEIAQNPRIGVVLRVAVLGQEKSGPESGAATVTGAVSERTPGARADGASQDGGGWSTGRVVAVAVGAVGVLMLAGLALAYVRARRKSAAGCGNSDPMRGGSW